MIRVFTKYGQLKSTSDLKIGERYYISNKKITSSTYSITTDYTFYIYTGVVATTWTLPDITGNENILIRCFNRGSNSITLNSFSGANDIYTTSLVSTVTIAPGEKFGYFCDGVYWIEN